MVLRALRYVVIPR